eukprot:12434542-Prorocentrum_lima.AAC.1
MWCWYSAVPRCFVTCIRCGYYAERGARNLTFACEPPSARGKWNLKRLASRLHPKTGDAIEEPVPL